MKARATTVQKSFLQGTITILSLFILPVDGIAAQSNLEQIVVTGTRTEKRLLDVPVRTEVVTRQQIEKQNARDLSDALKYVPGLMIKPIHGKTGSQVWIQGIDSDRVLILINGLPISASTGSSVDLSQVGVGDIDRIEIVKGATSALYGSSAMGGVINIITATTQQPRSGSVTLSAGNFGDYDPEGSPALTERHLKAAYSQQGDVWGLRLHGDIRDTDGYQIGVKPRIRGFDGYKGNAEAEVSYRPSPRERYISTLRYYGEDHKIPDSVSIPGQPSKDRTEVLDRGHVNLRYEREMDDGSMQFLVAAEDQTDETDSTITRKADMTSRRLEGQWTQERGENLLTVGGVVFKETLTQTKDGLTEISGGKETRENVEFFAQYDLFAANGWEWVPGVRMQNDSDFGSHVSPKLNLLYSPKWVDGVTTNVRIGLGHGYRVPNLKERHYVFDHSHLGYMVIGSPDLDPESSNSVQLGLEWVGQSYRFDGNLFYNRITDLIETSFSERIKGREGNPVAIFRYQNIGKSTTQGIELGAQRQWETTAVQLGYTYLKSEDRSTGNDLPKRPEHQVKASFDWMPTSTKAEFSLQAVYQSEEYIDTENTRRSPAWTTWDLKVNYPVSEKLRLFAGIENVTDELRDPKAGGEDLRPDRPRYVYAGMQFNY